MQDFTQLMADFQAQIEMQPLWVQYWINFMGLVNIMALLFVWQRVEARWALAAMVVIIPWMLFLYGQFGYHRILGLGHIPIWTPMLIWLWLRRDKWRVKQTLGGKWIALYASTIFVSLLFDYTDVARYLLGERG